MSRPTTDELTNQRPVPWPWETYVHRVVRLMVSLPPPSQTDCATMRATVLELGIDPPEPAQDWLGRYRRIASGLPGEIILNVQTLAADWHWFISQLDEPVSRRLSIQLARLRVAGVYCHEYFHHVLDIHRVEGTLTGSLSREEEEALVTAAEWRCVQRLAPTWKIPRRLVTAALSRWFEDIKIPGYRDWKKYREFCDFVRGVRRVLPEVHYSTLVSPRTGWCDLCIVPAARFSGERQYRKPAPQRAFLPLNAVLWHSRVGERCDFCQGKPSSYIWKVLK